MKENILRLDRPRKKEIKISISTKLPWPRVKKIIAVKNLLIEGWVEFTDDSSYLQGRIRQEIVYLDWMNVVRIYSPVLSFRQAEEELGGEEGSGCKPDFILHKHTYWLKRGRWVISRSFLQQEFNLGFSFNSQLEFLALNLDFGVEKITARLFSQLEQKEESWVEKVSFSLPLPAKEINSIDYKAEVLRQKAAEKLVSCSIKNIFHIYYRGMDDKEHYAQFEKYLSVQLVLDRIHSLSQLSLKACPKLINYRLSSSGYGIILDCSLTVIAEQRRREIRDVLVLGEKILPGLDYVSLPVLLSFVKDTSKKEARFDSTFRMPKWVANVIKVEGQVEIKNYLFKDETVLFEGRVIFDIYALDKKGRQHLIQEQYDFSLPMQFGDCGLLDEYSLEQKSCLTILGFSFESYQSFLAIHYLVIVEAELIKTRVCNLVMDILKPDLKIKKRPFWVEEVTDSDNYQLIFSAATNLINPAKKLLASRARVVGLDYKRKEDGILIWGRVEQELSFLGLDDVIHVQKDILSFSQYLKLRLTDEKITLKSKDIKVLPQLLQEENRANLDYLLTLNVFLTKEKLYDLPVSLGMNNRFVCNFKGSEEIINLNIPLGFKSEKPVQAYLKEIGLSYGINQTYLEGKLILIFFNNGSGGQLEEEIGFFYPLNSGWKNNGYPFFFCSNR
ncbi:MAG TPA: hypothetical protein GXX38_04755 [Clostridia bacterium]|nr:hypothetical protein [Clostridia bacterium]